MMIKQFDSVLLKDGREGTVTDVFNDGQLFYVDIGDAPGKYENIDVKLKDIEKVIRSN